MSYSWRRTWRFDARGSPCGEKRGGGGDEENEEEDRDVGFRIERRDAVKHAGDEAIGGERERESGDAAEDGDAQTLQEELGDDAAARGAEGEANADLALAHPAEVIQSAIEADAGERDRGRGEEREQDGAQAIGRGGLVKVLLQRHDGVERAGGLKLVNAAANGIRQSHGIAAGADEEVREGVGRAEAGVDGGDGGNVGPGILAEAEHP